MIPVAIQYKTSPPTAKRLFLHTMPSEAVWSIVVDVTSEGQAIVCFLSEEAPVKELLQPGVPLDLYRGPHLVATITPYEESGRDPWLDEPWTAEERALIDAADDMPGDPW